MKFGMISHSVFIQDLNCHLVNKVYLAGQKLSLADIMFYYALRDLLSDMMPQDKEMYINVSRWFRQVIKVCEQLYAVVCCNKESSL